MLRFDESGFEFVVGQSSLLQYEIIWGHANSVVDNLRYILILFLCVKIMVNVIKNLCRTFRKKYDAVVIGGGHNGLVAAAYMQKNGLKVIVTSHEKTWIIYNS